MPTKKLLPVLFALVALAQLYVPAQLIFERESILNSGAEFKFRTEPIDPNDPFRGKYITLNYAATEVHVANTASWLNDKEVYVILTTDNEGFAKIGGVSRYKPKSGNYIKARIGYTNAAYKSKTKTNVQFQYDFDRFYMEEFQAPTAEIAYREINLNRDPKDAYALVLIKDGETVIKDVVIDGKSISEVAKQRNAEKEKTGL